MPNQVEKGWHECIAFPHFPFPAPHTRRRPGARGGRSVLSPPLHLFPFFYSVPGPVCVLGLSPLLSFHPLLSPLPFSYKSGRRCSPRRVSRAQQPQNPSPPPDPHGEPDPVGERDWFARDLLASPFDRPPTGLLPSVWLEWCNWKFLSRKKLRLSSNFHRAHFIHTG